MVASCNITPFLLHDPILNAIPELVIRLEEGLGLELPVNQRHRIAKLSDAFEMGGDFGHEFQSMLNRDRCNDWISRTERLAGAVEVARYPAVSVRNCRPVIAEAGRALGSDGSTYHRVAPFK